MIAIAIVAALLAGYIAVRIILRTGGALARLLSRGLAAAGRAWRRADWLGRATQLAGWLFLAGLLLVPAGDDGSTWDLVRDIALTALACAVVGGSIALLARRVVRRIRRPRDDERAWQSRELLYADADREGHDVLLVNSEQFRVGVGQRCWTVHEATGEVEDTWFASQHIPVGSLVLAQWTTRGARHAYTWLTPDRLDGAARHDQILERQAGRAASSAQIAHGASRRSVVAGGRGGRIDSPPVRPVSARCPTDFVPVSSCEADRLGACMLPAAYRAPVVDAGAWNR